MQMVPPLPGRVLHKERIALPEASFGHEYARTSLDFAVPAMCAKEESRGVVTKKYH